MKLKCLKLKWKGKLPVSYTHLESGNNYILEADLPGFEKGDIKLDVKDDILTIKAERPTETEKKDKDSRRICCERSYGSYSRQFDVSGIDTDKISAKYENGVLKLTMPTVSYTHLDVYKRQAFYTSWF